MSRLVMRYAVWMLAFAALESVSAHPLSAQQRPERGGAARVFVLDSVARTNVGADSAIRGFRSTDLAQFVRGAIQLEALRSPVLRASVVDSLPPCGRISSGVNHAREAVPDRQVAGMFYNVSAQLDRSGPSYVLTFRIATCDGDSTRAVSDVSDGVSLIDATEKISVMSRDVVARLEPKTVKQVLHVVQPAWKGSYKSQLVRDSIGQTLQGLIRYQLANSDQFAPPAPKAPPTDSSGMWVTAQLSGSDGQLTVRFATRSPGNPAVDTLIYRGAAKDRDDFYIGASSSLFSRLQLLKDRLFDAGLTLAATPSDSLAKLGLAAACIGVGAECTPRTDNAIAYAEAVLARDSAGTSLSARREALLAAAEAYRIQSNFERALQFYDRAGAGAVADPAVPPPVIHGKLQTLRLAGRRIDAVRATVAAIDARPSASVYDGDFSDVMRTLNPTEVATLSTDIARTCARTDSLRTTCIGILRPLAEGVVDDKRMSRGVFDVVRRLATKPDDRADALLHIAASWTGSIDVEPDTGFWSSVWVKGSPDLATAFADSVGQPQADDRADLLRIQSLIARDRRDFRNAASLAARATQEAETPLNRFTRGQILYLYGTEPADDPSRALATAQALDTVQAARRIFESLIRDNYTPAASYLGAIGIMLGNNDVERARDTLRAAWRKSPKAVDLARPLFWLCQEQLHDFDCAYEVQQSDVAAGLKISPTDSIEAGESAVLSRHYDVALPLLSAMTNVSRSSCVAVVGSFYLFWSASALNRERDADRFFQTWRDAMEKDKVRESMNSCWVFNGAAAALQQNSTLSDRDLLNAMITAMRSTTTKLPKRSSSSSF